MCNCIERMYFLFVDDIDNILQHPPTYISREKETDDGFIYMETEIN